MKLALIYFSFLLPSMALAVSPKEIKDSKWESVYRDNDATFEVNNTLSLHLVPGKGDEGAEFGTGKYVTKKQVNGKWVKTGEGSLKIAKLNGLQDKALGIYGTWEMNGQTGAFKFVVKGNGKSFNGTWIKFGVPGSEQRGTWGGKIIREEEGDDDWSNGDGPANPGSDDSEDWGSGGPMPPPGGKDDDDWGDGDGPLNPPGGGDSDGWDDVDSPQE